MVAQRAHSVPGYDRYETERMLLKSWKVDNIDVIFKGEKATGPLPNPIVMREQMKLQGTQLKEQNKAKIEMAKLQSEMPKLAAEIDLLKAQVVEIISSVGAEKSAALVEQFELRIKAFEAISGAMHQQMELIQADQHHDAEMEQSQAESRAMGGVGDTPSNPSV
jgi:hypothetical protein